MKDLIVKRNKARQDAMRLREVKFEPKLRNEHSINLNKEQDELWHKYKFYDNLVKAMNKSEVKK